MKFVKILLGLIGITTVVILIILVSIGYFKPPKAGLAVISDPTAVVFVNGNQVGKTTYEGTFDAGEVLVRIVPESSTVALPAYEVKVNLISGVKTIVQHTFAPVEALSSGIVVSFEKITSDTSEIALVSNPDTCKITIDGQVRGYTPYKSNTLKDEEHEITVSCPNYQDKSIKIRTNKGYKLIGVFNLAKDPKNVKVEATATPAATTKPDVEKHYWVIVKDTPTGYLRVRSEASSVSPEIGRVDVGSKHEYLEEDKASTWFKIKMDDDKEGWVSSEFAFKEEYIPTPSPEPSNAATPSASPTL